MSVSAISKRYAKALVNLGVEADKVEKYGQELTRAESVYRDQELLRLLLESPTIDYAKKAAILSDVLKAMKLSDGVSNFVGLLLQKNRISMLPQIASDFRNLADERSGILRATITSPNELASKQVNAIRSGLETQTGKKAELKVMVDPNIIGGIKAEFGGKVFDGTLQTQLRMIEDTLKKG